MQTVTYICTIFPFKLLIVCINFQFKEISHAYEVLSDEKKRQIYDEGGEQALKEGGGGGHGGNNPFDIFDMFFGGGGSKFLFI